MLRLAVAASLLLGAIAPAQAHFLFVVPAQEEGSAVVILSENLDPDDAVEGNMVDPAKLFVRDAAGKSISLNLDKTADVRKVEFGPVDACVIYGSCELGVHKRGGSKPHLLTYHPKTVLKLAFDPRATLGEAAPVEIVPLGTPGDLRFQLLAKGQPVADAELTVILPDGTEEKATTDAKGQTKAFTATGRIGVWARHFEPASGEYDGKTYEEIRRYPTLVIHVEGDQTPTTPEAAAVDTSKFLPVETWTDLPEATSSFGAVAVDGWLYVYGGHIAPTHTYSTEAVSRRFHRIKLAEGGAWEELAGGPGIQGMNLAAHEGKIYRVGGMEPRNTPEEDEDNFSRNDCVCFDPASGQWTELPALPEPRSSHDIAVVGDKLYVIGGWNMQGAEGGNEWLSDMLVLDLKAEKPEWQRVKQPFERRALIVSVLDGKIYVFGGFDENDEPSLRTDIYDVASGTWSSGPDLPGRKFNGFAPAACTHEGRIYLSVGSGGFYRLDEAGTAWEQVAQTSPRIVHRLVPNGSKILVLGGAAKGDNLDLIEAVSIPKS